MVLLDFMDDKAQKLLERLTLMFACCAQIPCKIGENDRKIIALHKPPRPTCLNNKHARGIPGVPRIESLASLRENLFILHMDTFVILTLFLDVDNTF